MKVVDSAINLFSEVSYSEKAERSESLTVWKNGAVIQSSVDGLTSQRPEAFQNQQVDEATQVSLSQEVMRHRPMKAVVEIGDAEDDVMADLNIRILKALVERFTGKKIEIIRPGDDTTVVEGENLPIGESNEDQSIDEFGMAYNYHESYSEQENMEFSAKGIVVTEDGENIDLDINLNMSRTFYTEQNVQIRTGSALKDPLVINFSGKATELTQQKFSFDIDADGSMDQISFVNEGSGFLALDINNDQSINDGSELFGALTGSGFVDLREHDVDENDWIDENDAIFQKLRIWTKSSSGEDRLVSLGQKGIGAIYLGNINSPFAIKDSENELQGEVRSTGMFLREDGSGGTVQQIDLVA
jgi:hypothetical protein